MPLTKRDRGSGASADLALTIEDRWVPKESEPTVTKKKMRGLALDEEVDPIPAEVPGPSSEAAAAPALAPAPPVTLEPPQQEPVAGPGPSSEAAAKPTPASTPAPPVTLESLRRQLAAFALVRDWDQFHSPRNLALALVGEVGELCEIFQWRGDAGCGPGLPGWTDADKTHLGEELADVLLYLVRMADRCGVDLGAAAEAKLEKNARKYPADRARGSSAKYTAYQR